MGELTAPAVATLFKACLFLQEQDGDEPEQAVLVQGIAVNYVLHRRRLEIGMPRVSELLEELPLGFRRGDGECFLECGATRFGQLWTDSLPLMEKLCVLGLAVGLVAFTTPRETWPRLPAGLPNITVKL